MCSSFIDVGVRGERDVNFEPEPGASSYDPNKVVASLRSLSFQKPTKRYSSSEVLAGGKRQSDEVRA
jgi:hypothetical protein